MLASRKSSARSWIFIGVAAAILIAGFGLGIAMKVSATLNSVMDRTDKPASVALHFAEAMRKQDYTQAYGDLDHNATLNGQLLDQQSFIKLATAADSEKGYVLLYGLLADENDPTQFNITLQRGGQPYKIHVCLHSVGNVWKIMSIDSL